ncbi:MAG: hypothetical protein ABFS10_02340 [Bacteroidota bacterium]
MKLIIETRSIVILLFSALIIISTISGCHRDDPDPDPEVVIPRTLWLCPMPFDQEINPAVNPEQYIVSDYVPTMTDPDSYYPEVFKSTKVLKLYIVTLMFIGDEDLKKLVDFANDNDLEIAVEIGGIRMMVGHVSNDQIGEKSAEYEFGFLNRILEAGGEVNYITTDHSMAHYLTGRNHDLDDMSHEEIIEQMMIYFTYMQERMTGLKVGAIESLGFFWVLGDRQYYATDASLSRLDFETYFDMYLSVAEQNGVVLDHFHIDFGMHDVEYDNGYGRILAVEDYVMSNGVHSGFIATNAFHLGTNLAHSDDPEAAAASSATRTVRYFDNYIKAGGKSDYFVFQRWHPYPLTMGSYDEPFTQMGIFHSVLTSSWFPEDSKDSI